MQPVSTEIDVNGFRAYRYRQVRPRMQARKFQEHPAGEALPVPSISTDTRWLGEAPSAGYWAHYTGACQCN